MCVLAFAWRAHPRWRLVGAGNRDELHARPAAPLARWENGIVAGQDLVSGGTWMGVRDGRFAVVTNVRGGTLAPATCSRGELVTDALLGCTSHPADEYGAFNLIVADKEAATFSSNRPHAMAHPLASGLYGLANAGLDEPWPKTVRLRAILAEWLAGPATEPADLLAGLAEEAPDDPALAGIFIRDPRYGTRCSTVVAIAHDDTGVMIERRFASDGAPSGETGIEL